MNPALATFFVFVLEILTVGRGPLVRGVGIDSHYPPLTRRMKFTLAISPVAFWLAYKFIVPFSPWIAVLLGCCAVGWLFGIIGIVIKNVQRQGYRTAIDDLELLCAGEANFRNGYPANPRDLLAAAIVTLE